MHCVVSFGHFARITKLLRTTRFAIDFGHDKTRHSCWRYFTELLHAVLRTGFTLELVTWPSCLFLLFIVLVTCTVNSKRLRTKKKLQHLVYDQNQLASRVCFQSQLKDADLIAAVQQVVLPIAYEVRSSLMWYLMFGLINSLTRRIFFSRVNSLSIPPSVLPLWPVKDPGHSAKSAGNRLDLNTHTPLTQRSRSGLVMPLSRHSVGNYLEMSPHATC